MQMQTFQPQEVVAANPERIQVPTSSSAMVPAGPTPPSLLQVFAREAWKRKRLMMAWGIVTAVLIAFVVMVIAKPLFRAEGKLSYRPNYSRGAKPIYTPPNIQSAVQILKAPEVLEVVRAKHAPGMSKDEFSKNVRVEVSKQSEFVDVGFDHPDPAVAAAVANDLMEEGLKFFADVRSRTMKEAVVQVERDMKTARRQHEAAKEEYRKAHENRGVADPDIEHESLRSSLSEVDSQLRVARQSQAKLKREIKFLEARRDAPTDPSDAGFDEQFFPALQSMMGELQSKMLNTQTLEGAKIKLENARIKERSIRALVQQNVLPRLEYNEVLAEIRIHEATVKQGEELTQLREVLQKQYEVLKKKTVGSSTSSR